MNEDKAREAFEARIRSLNVCTNLARQSESVGGQYRVKTVQRSWEDWNAALQWAASQQAAEGRKLVLVEPTPAVAQVPRTLTPEEDVLVGRMREALKTAKVGEFAKVDPELMQAIDDAALRAAAPALLEIRKRERRLSWLHSPVSHNVDGYEWGIFRVKWERGRAVEVLQTHSDFSDLDSAIAAAPPSTQGGAFLPGEYERMTENGRKAWSGVDPQDLRAGNFPQGGANE